MNDPPSPAAPFSETGPPAGQGDQAPHAPVHLHHEGPSQGHAPGEGDPQGHLAVVLRGRQDRRPRRERRRQVDAPPDHGRGGQGLRGRGVPGRGDPHRVPAAGAPARPLEERAPARRGGGRGEAEDPAALRGDLGQLLGRHRRRVLPPAGPDRRAGPLGPRPAGRARDGRAAPAAGRRGRDDALGRREAAGGAVPPAAAAGRHAAARRAHQPPRRRVGGLARALPQGVQGLRRRDHPRPLLPRQRGRLDPRARPRGGHPLGGQLLVLARAEGPAPHPGGEGGLGPPPDASSASSSGYASPRAPGRPRARPASRTTRSCWPRSRRRRSGTTSARSRSRRGRAWATWSSTRRACARATATTC